MEMSGGGSNVPGTFTATSTATGTFTEGTPATTVRTASSIMIFCNVFAHPHGDRLETESGQRIAQSASGSERDRQLQPNGSSTAPTVTRARKRSDQRRSHDTDGQRDQRGRRHGDNSYSAKLPTPGNPLDLELRHRARAAGSRTPKPMAITTSTAKQLPPTVQRPRPTTTRKPTVARIPRLLRVPRLLRSAHKRSIPAAATGTATRWKTSTARRNSPTMTAAPAAVTVGPVATSVVSLINPLDNGMSTQTTTATDNCVSGRGSTSPAELRRIRACTTMTTL